MSLYSFPSPSILFVPPIRYTHARAECFIPYSDARRAIRVHRILAMFRRARMVALACTTSVRTVNRFSRAARVRFSQTIAAA
jgi:hypothetical protein